MKSRMRENCKYGSVRGSRLNPSRYSISIMKEGKSSLSTRLNTMKTFINSKDASTRGKRRKTMSKEMNTMRSFLDSIDVSTRGKRRKAMLFVINLLGKIHYAEVHYLERIPRNLQSGVAYSTADNSADIIINAIVELSSAYFFLPYRGYITQEREPSGDPERIRPSTR